jgi:hypothetical protein
MKLLAAVLGVLMLSACVTRQVERDTVVERPGVVVAPGTGSTVPPRDTTIVVPAR